MWTGAVRIDGRCIEDHGVPGFICGTAALVDIQYCLKIRGKRRLPFRYSTSSSIYLKAHLMSGIVHQKKTVNCLRLFVHHRPAMLRLRDVARHQKTLPP